MGIEPTGDGIRPPPVLKTFFLPSGLMISIAYAPKISILGQRVSQNWPKRNQKEPSFFLGPTVTQDPAKIRSRSGLAGLPKKIKKIPASATMVEKYHI